MDEQPRTGRRTFAQAGAAARTAVTGVLEDGSTMATFARWEDGQIAEASHFSVTL